MRLVLSMAGDVQVNRELTRIGERFTNMEPAFNRIANDLVEIERIHFATQGGGRWPPLSPRYKAWKDVHFPGQPILVRTGALRRSVTERPFGIEHITPYTMVVDTDVPYAKYHQFGTPRMPQRKVMDLTAAQRVQMVKTLQRFCMTGQV